MRQNRPTRRTKWDKERHQGARLVTCSVGRVEGEFGEEALTGRVAASDLLELDEVVTASHGVFMDALEMWFVPEAGTLQFGWPACPAGSKRHQWDPLRPP